MSFLTDPCGWWIEPFTGPFGDVMRNVLMAGLLTVASTSLVGTWVVLRGMSFFGDALAHGVLPGIAIAFIVGTSTSLGAFAAAIVMVVGINLLRSHSRLPDDTSIGVLFVGFLALAVVIMSSNAGTYTGDLNRFLFGSVTGVSDADLVRQGIAAVITVVGVGVLYRPFLLMTFDETQAQLLGFRPRLAHLALLVLLAVAIVASFEAVGNLLVFAFLVAPPAAASLLVHRVPVIMALAALFGSIAVVVGTLISYHHDTAAGATMALCSVVLFLVVVVVTSVAETLRSSRR